jgi:Fe2+ or Zn2+ uptake regulation protein/O6-methylguanine-DNA--protein-cysteine methyltransferase
LVAQNEGMSLTPESAGELLRARGMRATPQRRAILSVFENDRDEHLSADEIYARASQSVPELSRATVYATLAEFSELGLLSAFGTPDPVRYEAHLEPHAHFRCRLCQRIFDLVSGVAAPPDFDDTGFRVERVETRAEGICAECMAYEAGLDAAARGILRAGPSADTLSSPGAAVVEVDSPLGKLLLAATAQGLTRLAFEDHGDVGDLRQFAASRRGSQAARRHLSEATVALQRYFRGELPHPVCSVDWSRFGASASALRATETIPYASHRSYSDLGQTLSSLELGRVFGHNPIPIVTPCHRVARGHEIPSKFVGGPTRRTWLETHERTCPLV